MAVIMYISKCQCPAHTHLNYLQMPCHGDCTAKPYMHSKFLQAAFDHETIGRSRNTGMICLSTGQSESVEQLVAGGTNSPQIIT